MKTATKPKPADFLNNAGGTSNEWAVAAAIEPLDRVAIDMESRWGVGILERLVTPTTAAKFASARKKLDDAINVGDFEEVAKRAAVMQRGWKALEEEAQTAGHVAGDVGRFWCVEADDGAKYVFVMHERDVHAAAKKFPDHRVWSMREAVRILGAPELSIVQRAKQIFPGASVTAARSITDPLDAFAQAPASLDDEIPF